MCWDTRGLLAIVPQPVSTVSTVFGDITYRACRGICNHISFIVSPEVMRPRVFTDTTGGKQQHSSRAAVAT